MTHLFLYTGCFRPVFYTMAYIPYNTQYIVHIMTYIKELIIVRYTQYAVQFNNTRCHNHIGYLICSEACLVPYVCDVK